MVDVRKCSDYNGKAEMSFFFFKSYFNLYVMSSRAMNLRYSFYCPVILWDDDLQSY